MIVKALSLSLSRFLAGFWINKLQGSKGPKLKHLPVKALSLSLSRFCLKVKPFHFHFHKTPKGESRRLRNITFKHPPSTTTAASPHTCACAHHPAQPRHPSKEETQHCPRGAVKKGATKDCPPTESSTQSSPREPQQPSSSQEHRHTEATRALPAVEAPLHSTLANRSIRPRL